MPSFIPRKCVRCETWYRPSGARQSQCDPCHEIEDAEWWSTHGYPEREEQIPALRAEMQARLKKARRSPRDPWETDEKQAVQLAAKVAKLKKADPERVTVVKKRIASEHFDRYGLGAPMWLDLYYRAVLVRLGETPPAALAADRVPTCPDHHRPKE